MPKIFLSYRREDTEHVAGRLHDRLNSHFGREAVFMDIDTIPFGVDCRKHLDEAVGQCDILLAVIGEGWLDIRFKEGPKQGERRLDDPADFVRIEIVSALARGIPVIPVLIGRAAMPAAQQLPEALRDLAYRNAADVRSGRDFHDHVDRLIRGIEYLAKQDREAKDAEQKRQQQEPARPVKKQVAAAPPPNPPKAEAGQTPALDLGKGVRMDFAWVPPGTFRMGGGGGKPGDKQVKIENGFALGIYPVTQGQWQAVMGNNPSYFSRAGGGADKVKDISDADLRQFPVEQVSWEDVEQLLVKLNEKERASGWLYRLPGEAEWEYACRGGLTSKEECSFHFYFDKPTNDLSSKEANFDGNYPDGSADKGPYLERTTQVGSYPPNRLGLCDMHGNVWEWCSDLFEGGPDRVLRGGGWSGYGQGCRAAYHGYSPVNRSRYLGLRLARVPRPAAS